MRQARALSVCTVAACLATGGFVRLGAQQTAATAAAPSHIQIGLERTGCFGPCPQYRVTVDQDGRVTYDGLKDVRVMGRAEGQADPAAVRQLGTDLSKFGFFELHSRYDCSEFGQHITDLPTTIVTATVDGRTKVVADYACEPDGLRDLEKRIDDVTGSRHWVSLDKASLEELMAAGQTRSKEQLQAWTTALMAAAARGRVEAVELLLAAGADVQMRDKDDGTALTAGQACVRDAKMMAGIRMPPGLLETEPTLERCQRAIDLIAAAGGR